MFACHLSVTFHICLGGHQNHICFNVPRLPNLLYPIFNVSVAVGVYDWIGEYDPMGSFVERFGYVFEALLAGCIPDV